MIVFVCDKCGEALLSGPEFREIAGEVASYVFCKRCLELFFKWLDEKKDERPIIVYENTVPVVVGLEEEKK